MSSFANTPLNATVTGYASQGLGAFNQISRALGENTQTVSFVAGGNTLLSFDAVVQEQHGVDAQPTAFPIEDGSTISDHVIRVPRELSIQGIITDTPLNNKALLADEGITSLAGIVAGPLGVFALNQAQAFASSRAIAQSRSPSIAAFRQIVAMALGQNGQPPVPFTVRTAIADYPSMVIRSVQVPRDVTTGSALVFGMTLTNMRIVASVTAAAIVTASLQNVERVKAGEGEAANTGLAYKEGQNSSDEALGEQLRHKDVGSVYTGR